MEDSEEQHRNLVSAAERVIRFAEENAVAFGGTPASSRASIISFLSGGWSSASASFASWSSGGSSRPMAHLFFAASSGDSRQSHESGPQPIPPSILAPFIGMYQQSRFTNAARGANLAVIPRGPYETAQNGRVLPFPNQSSPFNPAAGMAHSRDEHLGEDVVGTGRYDGSLRVAVVDENALSRQRICRFLRLNKICSLPIEVRSAKDVLNLLAINIATILEERDFEQDDTIDCSTKLSSEKAAEVNNRGTGHISGPIRTNSDTYVEDRNHVNVVLLSYFFMGGTDGAAVAKVLRSKNYKGIIIGLLPDTMNAPSGDDHANGAVFDDEVREAFFKSGADAVLNKPIDFAAFDEVMRHLNVPVSAAEKAVSASAYNIADPKTRESTVVAFASPQAEASSIAPANLISSHTNAAATQENNAMVSASAKSSESDPYLQAMGSRNSGANIRSSGSGGWLGRALSRTHSKRSQKVGIEGSVDSAQVETFQRPVGDAFAAAGGGPEPEEQIKKCDSDPEIDRKSRKLGAVMKNKSAEIETGHTAKSRGCSSVVRMLIFGSGAKGQVRNESGSSIAPAPQTASRSRSGGSANEFSMGVIRMEAQHAPPNQREQQNPSGQQGQPSQRPRPHHQQEVPPAHNEPHQDINLQQDDSSPKSIEKSHHENRQSPPSNTQPSWHAWS